MAFYVILFLKSVNNDRSVVYGSEFDLVFDC